MHTEDLADMEHSTSVWFGTRGSAIYHARLNLLDGAISAPGPAADIQSPGFLCINQDRSLLYSLAKPDESDGQLAVFRIVNDKLKLLGICESAAAKGTHLSLSSDERTLLVAHYGAGKISTYALDDEGQIVRPVSVVEHTGSGRHPERQASAHPHWIGESPDGQFVFVPDLGLDQVVIYQINHSNHQLTKHGDVGVSPGQGPRHLTFHPNGKWAYVINELGLTVTFFEYDGAGKLTPIQTMEALAQDEVKSIETLGSEIRIHPTGKFLYAGIRGHDVIAAFSVNSESGELSFVEREPIRGSWPRNFALDPTGTWLLVAGDESNTIAVFRVDAETGRLTFTRNVVNVPNCICVAF